MAKTILVVEDNELNLELVNDVLVFAGYQVSAARDDEECLKRLQQEKIDLILMDIQLPNKDGYTLTRQIKQMPAYASIPIIALTAYAMTGDQEKAMCAGCTDVITKPINLEKFVKTIKQVLG